MLGKGSAFPRHTQPLHAFFWTELFFLTQNLGCMPDFSLFCIAVDRRKTKKDIYEVHRYYYDCGRCSGTGIQLSQRPLPWFRHSRLQLGSGHSNAAYHSRSGCSHHHEQKSCKVSILPFQIKKKNKGRRVSPSFYCLYCRYSAFSSSSGTIRR